MDVKKEINKIFDSSYWEYIWQQADIFSKKEKDAGQQTCAWDKRARQYDRRVSGEEGASRKEAVLCFLRDEGVLFQGMRIIDIGCGPGTLALPLAEVAGEVYALDPSEEMLNLLEEKTVHKKGYDNIVTVKARWQDIDIEEKGWQEAFDLSLASISPGVNDADTLKKLMRTSKRYCYLSTFAGRKDKVREEVVKILLGETPLNGGMDIVYPFNLLYTWGYRPALRFFRYHQKDHLEPSKAVEDIIQYLRGLMEIDNHVEETVSNYVDARLQGQFFTYEREYCQGMLLWDKNICFQE